MPSKFKPSFILDEQMYLADTQNALLYQIREELKDLNKNIKKLAEKEVVQDAKKEDVQPPEKEDTSKLENAEKKPDEKKVDKPEKVNEK